MQSKINKFRFTLNLNLFFFLLIIEEDFIKLSLEVQLMLEKPKNSRLSTFLKTP